MAEKIISVSAGNYDVIIGQNPFDHFNSVLADTLSSNRLFCIIMDENTHVHCFPVLCDLCPGIASGNPIVIPAGEPNKSYDSLAYITEQLTQMGADRGSLVINLGGGMICDAGGLAASLFKRGLEFINIPTTLLAMVDASIGGKVGINQGHFKNQIGLFAHPQAVLITSRFLDSLDKPLLADGMAEACKHGLIYDASYWSQLVKGEADLYALEPSFLHNTIVRSAQIKSEITAQDFEEAGPRKMLNFGHTLGHALETLAMDGKVPPISHGHAVTVGMVIESHISCHKAGLSEKELAKITGFLISLFAPYAIPQNAISLLYECMLQDKKNLGGNINCTLLKAIGSATINQPITQTEVLNAVAYYHEQLNTG